MLSRILFLIACRLSKAQEQFWEICLGGGGGQLPSSFGEACPGERQLSPIFWQRICRACRLRGQASKEETVTKIFQKSYKKTAKMLKNGTLEVSRNPLGAVPKGNPICRNLSSTFGLPFGTLLGAFLEPGEHILGTDFLMFFGYPSGTTFFSILEPKRPPK